MKLRLGEVMVQAGQLTQAQLDYALAVQRSEGGEFGHVVKKLRLITEEGLTHALALQAGLPYVNLDDWKVDPTLQEQFQGLGISSSFVLPVKIEKSPRGTTVTLAVSVPIDLRVIDEVAQKTGVRVQPVLASAASIARARARVQDLRVDDDAEELVIERFQ